MTTASLPHAGRIRPDAVARIAAIVHREAGIAMSSGKATLIRSRLAKRLRETGTPDLDAYVALIETDASERAVMTAALTTNHTSFFREAHHLDHVATLRDPWARRIQEGRPVRLWSAASSSGEEAYSIAMAVAGADRQRAAPFLTERFLILGTDLAPHAVAAARAATYAPAQLRNIPPPLAKAWTRGRTDGFTIAPELAGRCRFNHINLLGEWPMRQQFAAIFCRNVMIYFDEETQSTLLQRLVNALEPGGLLCIGHSERIIGPATSQLRSIGHTMFENIG